MNTAAQLIDEIQAAGSATGALNLAQTRERIHDAFAAATTEKERVALLDLHKLVMDASAANGNVSPENMARFLEVREQDYNLLLTHEYVIGENASWELLIEVTDREVAAGRMTEGNKLRQLALESRRNPRVRGGSIAELREIERKRLAALDRPPSALSKLTGWLKRK